MDWIDWCAIALIWSPVIVGILGGIAAALGLLLVWIEHEADAKRGE